MQPSWRSLSRLERFGDRDKVVDLHPPAQSHVYTIDGNVDHADGGLLWLARTRGDDPSGMSIDLCRLSSFPTLRLLRVGGFRILRAGRPWGLQEDQIRAIAQSDLLCILAHPDLRRLVRSGLRLPHRRS